MPDTQIDISGWTRAMAVYATAVPKRMQDALYEEWPFLLGSIIDKTPPFATMSVTSGQRSGPSSYSSSDYSVGRKAVNRDIRKTMRPFNPSVRTPQLEKILEKGDVEAFNAFSANVRTGPMAGAHAAHFSPDLHTGQRNARGRVGKGYQYVIIGPEVGMFKKYLNAVQDRVGYAKSGWLAALYLVGGNAPQWVAKHGTGGGSFIDNHADEDNPSITGINRTPWASRRDEALRIIQAGYNSRALALTSKVRVKLRLAAKEAGLAA